MASSWELESRGEWVRAPFKAPESIAAGKKATFTFQGLDAVVEFSSSSEGVVRCNGKEYPCRREASPASASPEAAPTDAATPEAASPEGTGKGKDCKGKGNAGPPSDKGKAKGTDSSGKDKGGDKGKGEGKSKGKAPMRSDNGLARGKKPTTADVLFGSCHQDEDGSYAAQAVADWLGARFAQLGQPEKGPELLTRFADFHPAMPTAFVVHIVEAQLHNNGRKVDTTVQAVVDSHGGEQERVALIKEEDKASAQEQAEINLSRMVNSGWKPRYGEAFLSMAKCWLEGQDLPSDYDTQVHGLCAEYIKMDVDKPVKRVEVSEQERQKKMEASKRMSMERRQKAAQVAAQWKSLQPRVVDDVPWDQVKLSKWCSGGSGGAFLVQVGESECVVLKELGGNAVQEYAAVELAHILSVRVAKVRIMAHADAETATMYEGLKAVPMQDGNVEMQAHRMSIAPFLMVMEFLPGIVLQGLDGNGVLTSGVADAVLKQLGGLIALDCVLNNVDRVPAIWMNEGNLGNVMIVGDGVVVGIDHQVNAIGDPSGKERYLGLLREFCGDCSEARVASPACKRIRMALLENTGVELSDAQIYELLAGAQEVFARIRAEKARIVEAITALDGKLNALFAGDANVGLNQLEKLLGFCVDCVNVIVEL